MSIESIQDLQSITNKPHQINAVLLQIGIVHNLHISHHIKQEKKNQNQENIR